MIVLGVVGSPRQNGRTNRLVDAALEGAKSRGSSIKKINLADFDVKPYTGVRESCPEELNKICEEADAIVLGSPIYFGDVSGLIKSFMETVRISNSNGKPALGISIAGGTGKGLLSGVQTIYQFFFHKQMRGIDPTPVSRFNLEDILEQLKVSGIKLVDLSKNTTPFPSWSEALSYYTSLKYIRCDPLDEFVMLAEQLIKISKGNKVENAKVELDKARALIAEGNRLEAAQYAVRSYQILYFPP